MNTNMITETTPQPQPPSFPAEQQLRELIHSLQHATNAAKQLYSTTTLDNRQSLISSLHSAHLSLSSFLSVHRTATAEDDEMMTAADEADNEVEEELNSKDTSLERVEEKMKELLCGQNKRLKRSLSPSRAAAVEERESVRVLTDFDPLRTRLRNLGLIYQFHA